MGLTRPAFPGGDDQPVGAVPPFGAIVVDEEGNPEWTDRRFPIFFIFLGCVAAVAIVMSPSDRSTAIAVGLVALAVSPWALWLFGTRLPDLAFVPMVLVPIGFLLIAGQRHGLLDLERGAPQLILMLVVGIVGQVAVDSPTRTVVITTGAAVAMVLAGAVVRGTPTDMAGWWVGILLAVAGGRSFQSSILRQDQLRAAQQALADQHLAEQRRRIARDVHDIVAHTMSVTMLHVTAARLALRQDPDAAKSSLEEAERHGRASLDDLRGIVRLLRTDEGPLDTALPAEADLGNLVDRYRTAGTHIEVDGDLDMSAAAADKRLAIYRIVQESLTNAVRHGTGPVALRIAHVDRAVEITVSNPADLDRSLGQGAGLTGMRERAEALQGNLTAGPGQAGQWTVRARIPT